MDSRFHTTLSSEGPSMNIRILGFAALMLAASIVSGQEKKDAKSAPATVASHQRWVTQVVYSGDHLVSVGGQSLQYRPGAVAGPRGAPGRGGVPAGCQRVSWTAFAATGGGAPAAARAEKVSNPYGSTAGAGSGEFHVYRHARAREAQRWKNMAEAEKQRILDEEFANKRQKDEEEEKRKTEKRRKKRQRAKDAKKRKRNLELSGIKVGGGAGEDDDDDDNENDDNDDAGDRKDSGRSKPNYDDEFDYKPEAELEKDADQKEGDKAGDDDDRKEQTSNKKSKVETFANDGSFLEMMKAKMKAEAAGKKQ